MDEDDEIGFTYFLTISYNQHKKDYPDDKIEFHDFSSICMTNWESLDEETKKKIIELAKKERIENEIKKERKPTIKNEQGQTSDEPIALDESTDEDEGIVDDFFNINNIIEIADSIKKHFGKHYTFCKKPRSSYIYFVKAARIDIKDRVQCSKDNFIEISRAISSKWNEMKLSQKKVFEDLAMLDKRFNGFRIEAAAKKGKQPTIPAKTTTAAAAKHSPLFLKAKAEACEHHASTSTGTPMDNLRNLLAARRARKDAERAAIIASSKASSSRTITKRKTKRKKTRTKKRKTKSKKTASSRTSSSTSTATRRLLPSTLPGAVKMERSIKSENKFKIKREIKLKREF